MPSTSSDFPQAAALAAAGRLDHAADQHAFAEAEFLDHRAGHKGIGAFAGEVVVGSAEEAVAVGVHFQDAGAGLERISAAAGERILPFRQRQAVFTEGGRPAPGREPPPTKRRTILPLIMPGSALGRFAALSIPLVVAATTSAAAAAVTCASTATTVRSGTKPLSHWHTRRRCAPADV